MSDSQSEAAESQDDEADQEGESCPSISFQSRLSEVTCLSKNTLVSSTTELAIFSSKKTKQQQKALPKGSKKSRSSKAASKFEEQKAVIGEPSPSCE